MGRARLGSPLAWILAALLVLRIVGIGWGLPASDGWDNDGIAPRDFLAGLVETALPGRYFTYPPVHLALLAVLTAPVTIVALVRAPSLAAADVIGEILKVPYMTVIAYTARVVSLLMSLGLAWAIAKITEELRGRRAGWCAAAFVGVNVPLTYYAHTTNLDVPYLFWGSLALLALVRAVARRQPTLLRRWAVLAALAVGTKDQAYALFLVSVPLGLAIWLALDSWARASVRVVLREAAIACGILVGILIIADGVVYNPGGFRERVHFLLGPASQAYAHYTNDWLGRSAVVRDLTVRFDLFYPLAFAPLVVLGLVILLRAPRRADPARLVAGMLPLLVAISFTLTFNCIARRTDQRFALPQTVLMGVYGGIALDVLMFELRPAALRWVARAGAVAAFAVALFAAADVDANLLFDPRYEAEAWMREHVAPGDLVETYGLNVYLPRFPREAHVIRVGPEPGDHKNPMPGIEEVLGAYGDAAIRKPRFVVLSEGWTWRYLLDPNEFPSHGHMLPPTQRETGNDQAASAYFKALTRGEYGPYRLAHVARWESRIWPPIELHASTSRQIWVYEQTSYTKPQ
jgi:4-amino-4-deoxy-L-arabinose transferase-like glycosyltransferase